MPVNFPQFRSRRDSFPEKMWTRCPSCQEQLFNNSILAMAVAQASGFAMKVGPCMKAPASPSLIPVLMRSLHRVAASVI